MGQTFQKGDIVLCGAYNWSGIFQEIDEDGSAHFRDRTAECVCEISELAHDRDFQVGDWVRYEGTHPSIPDTHLNGQVGKISALLNQDTVSVDDIYNGAGIFRCNLVKIAPPTEEKVSETVTIEHDQWGRVEGVIWAHGELAGWEKDGAIRLACDGWREVKVKKWVRVAVKLGWGSRQIAIPDVESGYEYYILPHGYRWKMVEIEKEVNY